MLFSIVLDKQDGTSVSFEKTVTKKGKGETRLFLSPEEIGSNVNSVSVFMPEFSAVAGDDGYYVHSYNGGALTYFTEREDCDFYNDDIGGTAVTMPIFGVKKDGKAYLLIATSMTYDSRFVTVCKDNKYSCMLFTDTDGDMPYEPIELVIYEVDGEEQDYSAIARTYRKYQLDRGACKPLSVRAEECESLDYLAKSLNIRVRMGWKPVPPEVMEQTEENEPEMKVACTFEMVEELIDELKARGVERADICLVGFNKSGHDGRWPQLFPIEPKLGGEEGFKKLIKKAKDAGYYINVHTNAIDAYSIADCFSKDLIMKNRDGSLSRHPDAFSAGIPYRPCPIENYDYFMNNLDRLGEFEMNGAHYIDCLTVVPVRRCFDKNHPMNRREWTEWMNKFLEGAKERFGCISSEGGMDFSANVLDFALYSAWKVLGKKERAIVDEFVPLWQLVYHGIILYNATTETVNYSVKSTANRLKEYEYGGRASAYCFSRFMGGGVDFLGLEDIAWEVGDKPEKAAEQIAEMDREYKNFYDTVYAFMDKHEKLSEGVFCTTYSNGIKVVTDYNTGDIKIMK
ncbi:MAG: hypothetical protein IKT56_02460 [Clostridia bacterium]|nr:hypothetical protein [Clostridia bacterium]